MLEVYPTGFSELDYRFGGIRPGELTVLTGFPSTGKTQILSDIADFLDVPTLYFGQHTRPPGQWTRRRRPELFVDSTEHGDFAAIERPGPQGQAPGSAFGLSSSTTCSALRRPASPPSDLPSAFASTACR